MIAVFQNMTAAVGKKIIVFRKKTVVFRNLPEVMPNISGAIGNPHIPRWAAMERNE